MPVLFFGRLVPKFSADKTQPINMFFPCTLFTGVMVFTWFGIKKESGLFTFAILYGFVSGFFVRLQA